MDFVKQSNTKNIFIKNLGNSQRYKAFTLAEVLITLGIIGIVAAMTIPTLISNTQDSQTKQTFKKEFAAISNAYNRVKQDEGGDLSSYFSGTSTNSALIPLIGNYLNISKSCNGYYDCATGGGLTSHYISLSGGAFHHSNFETGQFILSDGVQIYFRGYSINYLLIFVDVNGYTKGPNILGEDLFGISVTKNWIRPMGATGTGVENTCNTSAVACSSAYGFNGGTSSCAGAGCASVYLYQ